MKKSILFTLTATIAVVLSGCSDAEMAKFEHDVNQNMQEMQILQRECKNYISAKVNLPMAAINVSPGYGSNGRHTLPVRIKWDRPFVDEKGQCIVVNGIAREYRITD